MTARTLVDQAIASFAADPADTDYQRGYLAALEWVRDEAMPGAQFPDLTPENLGPRRWIDPAVLDRPIGEVEPPAPTLATRLLAALFDWRGLLVVGAIVVLAVLS